MNVTCLEGLRRLTILIALPVGVMLIVHTRPQYLRFTAVNWEQRRDREIAALLSEEARGSLSAYVAEKTLGHVVSLPTATWGEFLNAVRNTLVGHSPTNELRDSFRSQKGARTSPALMFLTSDARFAKLLVMPELTAGYAYLQLETEASSAPTLLLSIVETRYSMDAPPRQLIHPLRHAGWWVILVGAAIYGLIPWPTEHATEMRFTTPVTSFLADLVGVLLYGGMIEIWAMLVLQPSVPGHGEWSQILVLSSVFGLMACAGVTILLIALWYITLQIEWSDAGLTFRSLRQTTFHSWADIVSLDVAPMSYPYAKKFRALGLLLSLFNWRAAGPALLVQTESRVLRLTTRQSPALTIDIGNTTLRHLWMLIAELEARSIAVTSTAKDLGESDRQASVPRRWPVHQAVALLSIPILYALARTYHAS